MGPTTLSKVDKLWIYIISNNIMDDFVSDNFVVYMDKNMTIPTRLTMRSGAGGEENGEHCIFSGYEK